MTLPSGRAHDDVTAALHRGADWAQPFPEWGLAGNAALVIGPRALTTGMDLQGRVFLHSYAPEHDHDHSTLEVLLTAPAVVAQWINSQYYFSTVDPERFGAGDKTTHNVVGDIGVLSGAHGDLRVGLPWQSLFSRDPRVDPTSFRHEPLRLVVIAWADADAVLQVVRSHEGLRNLVVNDWIALMVIDPHSRETLSLSADLAWAPWAGRQLDEQVDVSR
jgi:uncharacterized protein YbcC (UPF0753/DUF2309 family)